MQENINVFHHRNDRLIVLLHYTVMWMMAGYLVTDMLSGLSVIYIGIDLKVSLIYKTPLFGLLLLLIGRYNFSLILIILSIIVIFMTGPLVSYFSVYSLNFLLADFAYVVKIIMPMTVLAYFYEMSKVAPEWALKWAKRILWCGFFTLLVNFMFGALGFGRATYSEGKEDAAGSTGFMLAGNELGAAYLLLFGYALHHVWNHKSFLYFILLSLITIGCGVLVATKTTMLASIILVFMIPIVNERNNLYRITWLKLKILIPVIIVSTLIIVMIVEILESVGLWERILWFYNQRGLISIIWSNRDQFILDMMQIFLQQNSLFEQLFGQGTAISLKHSIGSATVEVDIVDSLTWFGLFGVVFCSSFYLYLLFFSGRLAKSIHSMYAPCVFLVNSLLLLLSFLSGHIWMSGTLGIAVGVLNALLWFETKNILIQKISS